MSEKALAKKRFRTAYITQNAQYDFQPILNFCQKIVFVTSGYETDETLEESITDALKNFDPNMDLIVPVGPVAINFAIGYVLSSRMPQSQRIAVALYREKQYEIQYI